MEDPRDTVDLTPGLQSPGPMPPDPEPPRPAPLPFSLPIPRFDSSPHPAAAGDGAFGVLLVDDNTTGRANRLLQPARAMRKPSMSSLAVLIPEETLYHCFWCERRHRGEYPLGVCPACTIRLATMRLLQMSGSYPLTAEAIDDALKRKSPGNYALGYMDGDAFSVFYVGRSDSDVRRGLRSWLDKPATYGRFLSPTKAAWQTHRGGRLPAESTTLDHVGNDGNGYTRFAYSYAGSAEDAYAKEWRNYDSFGGRHGLDNEVQPILAVS